MKATVRARLTIGFLALVTIGSVASVAILTILSGTIDELKRVVTVSDTVEHKALEMRFDMLAMSDAMRGFLINPASTAERTRKKQADEHFEAVVEEIRKLAPQGEILGLLQTAADMDSEMSAAAPNRASHRERNLIDMDRSSCDEQLVDAIAPDEYLTSVSATHLIAGGTWVRVRGRLCGEGGLS